MNNVSLLLYGIEFLSSLRFVGALTVAVLFFSVPLQFIAFVESDDELTAKLKTIIKKTILAIIVISLFLSLIPSKNVMYMMVASELGENVITDPKARSILDKSLTVLEDKLDEQLDGSKTP